MLIHEQYGEYIPPLSVGIAYTRTVWGIHTPPQRGSYTDYGGE